MIEFLSIAAFFAIFVPSAVLFVLGLHWEIADAQANSPVTALTGCPQRGAPVGRAPLRIGY